MSAYLPILAAERTRLAGLAATTDAVKDRLTPLFDVPPFPRTDGDPDRPPASDAEARLAAVVDAVAATFGPRRAYLDCEAVDHRRVADGRLATAYVLDEARGRGLALVPVTGLRRSAAHQLAVADAASVDGRGACLRLQFPDFAELESLPHRAQTLVDRLGMIPEQVDVLVDLGRVSADESRVLTLAARAVLTPLRRAAAWRAVAVAAAGCAPQRPARVGGGRAAEVERVPRTEWLLWRTLAADAPALGFGDYAGPVSGEGGAGGRGGAGRGGGWLGYAHDAEWLVVRAAEPADAPAGNGAAPPLAALAGRPEFYGPAHCAGDARMAAGAAGGRLAEWQAAAVTHHLTVTVEGIAAAERGDR